MSCVICGRGNCTMSFHSLEEQSYFEEAEQAFERYLDIRERCRQEWLDSGSDEEENAD